MTLKLAQFCDDPQKISTKSSYPKKIFIFLKTQKNIEIQNFEPKKMGRAYVCVKISEYPPPPPWALSLQKLSASVVETVICRQNGRLYGMHLSIRYLFCLFLSGRFTQVLLCALFTRYKKNLLEKYKKKNLYGNINLISHIIPLL